MDCYSLDLRHTYSRKAGPSEACWESRSLFILPGVTQSRASVIQLLSHLWLSASHGLQHARLPCLSSSAGVCSNPCPLSQWCHPTISSSGVPFSSWLQSFPTSRSFPISWPFISGGQSIRVSASASVFSMNIQGALDSPITEHQDANVPVFFFFGHAQKHVGSYFPDWGSNQEPFIEAQSLKQWTTREVPTCLSLCKDPSMVPAGCTAPHLFPASAYSCRVANSKLLREEGREGRWQTSTAECKGNSDSQIPSRGKERTWFPSCQDTGECPEPRSTFPPRYQLFSLTELVVNMVFLGGNNEILDVTYQN